jgi:hypothetical protein
VQNEAEQQAEDAKYLQFIIEALQVCKNYKPKFGQTKALTLEEFQALYQADVFYNWFGLASPYLYAAHKAAGGITSVYRQIGLGCQRLFVQLLIDKLGLQAEDAIWSYNVIKADATQKTLSLDGRIVLNSLQPERKLVVNQWLNQTCKKAGVADEVRAALKSCIFEVRQGYKSKDSKRQNADVDNAGAAFAEGYLPVVLLLSTQIDGTVAARYTRARWLLLKGTLTGSSVTSTYIFCREVLNYDLASFFQKYSAEITTEVENITKELLQ